MTNTCVLYNTTTEGFHTVYALLPLSFMLSSPSPSSTQIWNPLFSRFIVAVIWLYSWSLSYSWKTLHFIPLKAGKVLLRLLWNGLIFLRICSISCKSSSLDRFVWEMLKSLKSICLSMFSTISRITGADFDTATIEFSVLFAPKPLIRSFKYFTWFSFSISAALFFPFPPLVFTNDDALTWSPSLGGKIISVF